MILCVLVLEVAQVMRGLWYLEADWQPIEEEDSEKLEEEHLLKFENQKHAPEAATKGSIQG